MDEYGNIDAKDLLGLGSMFVDFKRGQRQQKTLEMQEKLFKQDQAYKEKMNLYGTTLMNNPEAIPPTGEQDFNVKAWNDAKAGVLGNIMNSDKAKEAHYTLMNTRFEHQRKVVMNGVNKVAADLRSDNIPGAQRSFEEAYEQFFDGRDVRWTNGGKGYEIVDKMSGEIMDTKEFDTPKQLMEHLVATADGMVNNDAEFSKTVLGNYQRMIQHNYAAETSGKAFVNEKGEIGYKTPGKIDLRTGRQEPPSYYAFNRKVSEREWKNAGFAEAETQQKASAVKENLAQARAHGRTGLSGFMSPEEKLSRWYSKVYKVDLPTATQMVREEDLDKAAMGALVKHAEDNMTDFSNPDDVEEFLKVRKAILGMRSKITKAPGVNEPTKPTGKPSKPPKKGGKSKKVENMPEGAVQADDGKWYVNENGLWFEVVRLD